MLTIFGLGMAEFTNDLISMFPGVHNGVYMDVAARGLLPLRSKDAVDKILDQRINGSMDKTKMFKLIENTRKRYAKLINAEIDEVAFTKNVSEGLNAIIAGFDWKIGDNAVICVNLEHPNNVYPWKNIAIKQGISIHTFKPVKGEIFLSEIKKVVNSKTRMISISSVTFAPGFRCNLKEISNFCKKKGIFLLVDAVQSVGILHTDVKALDIDAMAVSTQKGLLGLYGMGFLYCKKESAEKITPAYLARFGVDLGESAHEADLGPSNYILASGAKRFDLGNFNFAAAAAVYSSMGIILDLGTYKIEKYVVGLANVLSDSLIDLGLPVLRANKDTEPGTLVSVGLLGEGQHDSANDQNMTMLFNYLKDNNVKISIRRGILRFSLHLYNTLEDVNMVANLIKDFKTKMG